MNPQFAVYLFRLLRGERIEKAQAWDYRYWLGHLFLTPVLISIVCRCGEGFWNSSGVILWAGITIFGLLYLCASLLWARFVPAIASLALAVPAWIMLFLCPPFK
jgi:hypothetical protein